MVLDCVRKGCTSWLTSGSSSVKRQRQETRKKWTRPVVLASLFAAGNPDVTDRSVSANSDSEYPAKGGMACLMSEYLTKRFRFRTLVLLRHPAGLAWGPTRISWPIGTLLRQFCVSTRSVMSTRGPRPRATGQPRRTIIASSPTIHSTVNRQIGNCWA